MHASFDTGETLDLGDLPTYWAEVERRAQIAYTLPDLAASRTLTARYFDEAQTAGTRTYINVQRYLSVALDNHHALLALIEKHGATHSAPWSLMRPTFECAFFAAWILDPVDGKERRIRGLRTEVRDEMERRTHMRAYEIVPEVADQIRDAVAKRREVEKIYRDEAARLGVPWERVHQKVNVVDELPKLSFIRDDEPIIRASLVATWRMLSGYEHGLGYAMMRGSDLSAEVKIPGGYEARLTINDDAFVTAGKVTVMLLLSGLNRLIRLHSEP